MGNQDRFLQETLGEDGAAAILKAASKYSGLEGVLVPRAILAWLRAESNLDCNKYSNKIFGIEYDLTKTESGWSGNVNDYTFKDQSLFHVAGALAVALGVEAEVKLAKDKDIELLGKSMDLLAKARVVNRELYKKKAVDKTEEGIQGTGSANNAMVPQAPTAMQPVSLGTKAPKGLPKPKKQPALRVMKSESTKPCKMCGTSNFKENSFVGCSCFKALSKSVKVTFMGDSFHLEFGKGWDREAIITLAENWNK